MFRNYLLISYRNLKKNFTHSLINVLGMAIGFASFFLIMIFIQNELKFDQFYKDKTKIYRVNNSLTQGNGSTSSMSNVPPVFGPALKEEFPEVKSTLRIFDPKQDLLFKKDENSIFIKGGVYSEPSIFDILEVELVQGNQETALVGPNKVILSKTLSQNLFGDENMVGKSVNLSNEEYTITGIYKDFSKYSHLDIPIIRSFDSFLQYIPKERMESWVWHQFYTYVEFISRPNIKAFENKVNDYFEPFAPTIEKDDLKYTTHFKNISGIYLNPSDYSYDISKKGNAFTVYALFSAGIFILIIVCLNFINLSTAQSLSRLKEIGVRKVIGARKKQLIIQFISESIFLSLIAIVIGGVLTEVLLSCSNFIFSKHLDSSFLFNPVTLMIGIFFAICMGFIAGIYPAFYATRFSPSAILGRGGYLNIKNKNAFRNILVVVQFSLSTILIIVSAVIYNQVSFLLNGDMGFEKDHIMTVRLYGGLRNNFETTKNEFLSYPDITSVTFAYGLPGDIVAGDRIIEPVSGTKYSANHFMVDPDYVNTMGLEIIAGRDFDKNRPSDAIGGFIINEEAVKNLGFGSPDEAVGRNLNWDMWHYPDSVKKGKVIGVVKNFNYKSMKEEISTAVIHIYPRSFYKMALRISPNNVKSTIDFIESKYSELEPTWPITYSFIDQEFEKMYQNERSLEKLVAFFTSIGIFIACFGLFGLVNYSTKLKMKEVGIRKVLGASGLQIVSLLIQKFLGLIVISFVIGIPISYYFSNKWLMGFEYKIDLGLTVFFGPPLLLTIIALLSISYQSIKTSLINPSSILKDD